MMPYREAVIWLSSTFSLPTTSLPAYSCARASTVGATMWHGPHHGAQKSTSTGRSPLITCAKLASVKVMGLPSPCGEAERRGQAPVGLVRCSRAQSDAGAGRSGRTSSAVHQIITPTAQCGFRNSAISSFLSATILDKYQSRQVGNVKAFQQFGLAVGIDLGKKQLAGVVAGKFVERWIQLGARSAIISPEDQHNWQSGIENTVDTL